MGEPSYEIVVTYVTSRIRSGEWPPGHQLPYIKILAELTGQSQTAVKTALMVLRERGLVRSQQGKGVWVAEAGGLNAQSD